VLPGKEAAFVQVFEQIAVDLLPSDEMQGFPVSGSKRCEKTTQRFT